MPAENPLVEPTVELPFGEPSRPQPKRNAVFEARHLETLNRTRAAVAARRSGRGGEEAHERLPGRQLTSRQATLLKRAFLDKVAASGNIGWSCDQVGISRSTYYHWQEHDEQFALAYHQAEIRATEVLEKEAWRRATEGSPYTRTSYYRGEPVGTDHKIEYSDQLLTLLLRARAPERYREKVDLAVSQVIKTVAGVDPLSVL